MAMKFGLMRAHQERTRNEGRVVAELPAPARKTAEPQGKGLLAGRQLEDFLSASLTEDLAVLKGMAAVSAKAAHKRDALLPKYAPYIERLKESGAAHDLLGYWLVWLFDAGKIEEGISHGEWCMAKGLSLPQKFSSTIPYFVATQVTEWAEKEWNAGRAVQPYFDIVWSRVMENPDAWNLPDELRARFFRLKGMIFESLGDLEYAEQYFASAMDLGAKVKTALERVRKNMKKGTDEGAQAPGEAPVEAPGEDAAGDDSPAALPGDAAAEE